ncbi:MAG TPA: organic hydroperoxide resistance protein [Candidatus Saccharimonadales bacterium]|jgi:osmotically inducible protein OsmC|nr:organic hydroperoxide resistance protein [Candidatus Saccharimonadales bacterium]
MKILYTAAVTATGARHGHVESSDGKLSLPLALPPEMGGAGGATNPEQLFAGGYAACFGGAMEYIARQGKIDTGEIKVAAKVGIGPNDAGSGFGLAVELDVRASALAQADLEKLAREAHQVCPYSNATRGNIEVKLTANGKPI